MIIGFWQTKEENGYLSNWYKAEFNFDGHHFYNSEQAFMYLKAKLFNDVEMIEKILNTKNPVLCKRFGRAVKQFDSKVFDQYKYQFMVAVLIEKFSQNPELLKLLLNTNDSILVEASPKDKIWGIGIGVDHVDFLNPDKWPGKNLLGKALMEVRDKLKNNTIQ